MKVIDIAVLHMAGVKTSDGNGRKPVDFPEIYQNELNPLAITACLENDKPILGWLCTEENEDFFWLYMVEDGDLLCKYYAIPMNSGESWLLLLTCVFPMSFHNVSRLFESDFEFYSHVYLDEEGYFNDSRFLEKNIDFLEIRERLKKQDAYFIPEEISVSKHRKSPE